MVMGRTNNQNLGHGFSQQKKRDGAHGKWGRTPFRYTDNTGVNLTRTITVGNVEFIKVDAGPIKTKRYIGGVMVVTDFNGVHEEHALLSDHLGSTVVMAKANSLDSNQQDYDAFGKRRNLWTVAEELAADKLTLNRLTTTGFTGHEMLDEVGLIHMQGRVYDPHLGRFLSADPFITELDNTQNMNRYSYVYNNPLTLTDPSGFCAGSLDCDEAISVPWFTYIPGSLFDQGGCCFAPDGQDYYGQDGQPVLNPGNPEDLAILMARISEAEGLKNYQQTPTGPIPPSGFVTADGATAVDIVLDFVFPGARAQDILISDVSGEKEQRDNLTAKIASLVTQGILSSSKIFSSPDAAAKEVLVVLAPLSQEYGLELGGAIERNKYGWNYTIPHIGDADSVITIPKEINYHTHPDGRLLFSNIRINAGKGSDATFVNTGYALYLGVKIGNQILIGVCEPGTCEDRGFPGTPPSRTLP